MDIVKNILSLLNQIQKKYREIQKLSRWQRGEPNQDLAKVNGIIRERTRILLEIDQINARLNPLRESVKAQVMSDVLRKILHDQYTDLNETISAIREEDARLMKKLERKMSKIKMELGTLGRRSAVARQYTLSMSY